MSTRSRTPTKNDADKVDAKIKSVTAFKDGGFNIVMTSEATDDVKFTVELKERVNGDYKSIGTKTVTLKKGEISVSDGENKFVLETGKVYKMVVNGVESNDIKGA